MALFYINSVVRITCFLLFYFLIGLTLTSCAKKREVYGVVFGDSLANSAGVQSVSSRLSNCLSIRTGLVFKNLGIDGNTSLDGLNRINEVVQLNPKVVIVSLGGNDVLRYLLDVKESVLNGSFLTSFRSNFSKSDTYKYLSSIYETLKKNNIEFLHLGLSPPKTLKKLRSLLVDDRLQKIQDVVESYGGYYLPKSLDDLWLSEHLMADDLHPNDAGNAILCDRIYNFLLTVE